jgi:hypothetical protein
MNRILSKDRERGFTILEAMLAVMVLMLGVGMIAKLNESMRRSIAPGPEGLLQHVEVVDMLLRDAAETVRANPPLVGTTLSPLSMGGAVYTARISPPDTSQPVVGGYQRLVYTVEVSYETPDSPSERVGTLLLDAISPAASAGVRVGL